MNMCTRSPHAALAAQSDSASRKADITRIQIARKELKLSDEVYRTILAAQGQGVTSSKDLNAEGRRQVLAYLARTYGWGKKKAFSQAEMIDWLWRKLGQTGALHDPSLTALMAFVGRTAGVEVAHLRFLPVAQAAKVIEALKAWLKRAQK